MKVVIASDHRGIDVKKELVEFLKNEYEVLEIETVNKELDDYPDFAFKLCNKVLEVNAYGILICGNGIGMSIAANKVKGIRCARVVSVDDAIKAKSHNGCNVISIGANLDLNEIKKIVVAFLTCSEELSQRHLNRVNKIINYENGEYNEL